MPCVSCDDSGLIFEKELTLTYCGSKTIDLSSGITGALPLDLGGITYTVIGNSAGLSILDNVATFSGSSNVSYTIKLTFGNSDYCRVNGVLTVNYVNDEPTIELSNTKTGKSVAATYPFEDFELSVTALSPAGSEVSWNLVKNGVTGGSLQLSANTLKATFTSGEVSVFPDKYTIEASTVAVGSCPAATIAWDVYVDQPEQVCPNTIVVRLSKSSVSTVWGAETPKIYAWQTVGTELSGQGFAWTAFKDMVDDGDWWKYDFLTTVAGSTSVNVIFGTSNSPTNANCTDDVTNITTSSCFDVLTAIAGGNNNQRRDVSLAAGCPGGGTPILSVPTPVRGVLPLVNNTTAQVTLYGYLKLAGCDAVTAYGFEYADNDAFANKVNLNFNAPLAIDETFEQIFDARDLECGEVYYYRVYAINSKGTGYSVTHTFVAPCPPSSAVYRSTQSGEWGSPSRWQSSQDGNTWSSSLTSPSEVADLVILSHTSIVSNGNVANVKNIIIEPTGKMNIGGSFTVSDTITIVSNNNASGQVYANGGTIQNNGVVVVRKSFTTEAVWHFVSFPFDVPASKIYIGGTKTQAVWGDLEDINVDFFVAQYDGARRDATGKAVLANSANWVNVSPRVLRKNIGYIIAVPVDITLDFVSAIGEIDLFGTTATVGVNKFTTNALPIHNSWNLLGNPFTSWFDLIDASQIHAPFYYYNGRTYNTVMDGENHDLNPFGAFFIQAHGPSNNIGYASNGRKLRSVSVPESFEQISLTVKDNAIEEYFDNTRIRIQEGRTLNYEFGYDAIKMISNNSKVPQIYTKTKAPNNVEYTYSVNSLPPTVSLIDLVVTTGKSGKYTLSLLSPDDAPGYSSILLLAGNNEYDLLEGDYVFNTTRAATFNWKVLLVAGVATDVVQNNDATIKVSTSDNKVYITGLESVAKVLVHTLSGTLLHVFDNVSNNQALAISQTGIYVLSISNETQKATAKVIIK